MNLAIDVHYQGDEYAVASGVLFRDWASPIAERSVSVCVNDIKPYKSGRFFERELPCVLALLRSIDEMLDVIVIDGYVTLGEEKYAGLGTHVYNAIEKKTPIIGVAKNSFNGTPEECKVFRGKSQNPLYVTSVGLDLHQAKRNIALMHGAYRVPTLLKLTDSECREKLKLCSC